MTAMEGSFTLFDHTADVGLRIRAGTLAGLLEPAAKGLYAAIGELVPIAAPSEQVPVELSGGDAARLLRDFLHELLMRFERKRQIAVGVSEAHLEEGRLEAVLELRDVDGGRSGFDREVKAITYHELAIRPVAGGYEATVIVDI